MREHRGYFKIFFMILTITLFLAGFNQPVLAQVNTGFPLMPIGISIGVVNMGPNIALLPDTDMQGNFGLLDFDGGNNSKEDLIEWIKFGFPGSIVIPDPPGHLYVDGNPGMWGNYLNDALFDRVGSIVLFPVYDAVLGNGAITVYSVIGFVEGKITGFDLTGSVDTDFPASSPERRISIELLGGL